MKLQGVTKYIMFVVIGGDCLCKSIGEWKLDQIDVIVSYFATGAPTRDKK